MLGRLKCVIATLSLKVVRHCCVISVASFARHPSELCPLSYGLEGKRAQLTPRPVTFLNNVRLVFQLVFP